MSLLHRLESWVFAGLLAACATALPSQASAELITLRVGSGHPAGPTVYVTVMRDFVVPELKRRVAEETEHELRIIEGYAVLSVAAGESRYWGSSAKRVRFR